MSIINKSAMVIIAMLLLSSVAAYASNIEIDVVTMDIVRSPGTPFPEVREIPSASGGKAIVWGATADECRGASASIVIPASKAPSGDYTLWLRQSYSDRGAVSPFTGIEIDINGKLFKDISGPKGELYYTTSIEKFYWTPVFIGVFNGGTITITRDASGGGLVATDKIILTVDSRWLPDGYSPVGQFPKTVASFAGPAIKLPVMVNIDNDNIMIEAETMMIDKAGIKGGTPSIQKDLNRWGKASGGGVVAFHSIIDENEAKKSLKTVIPQLKKNTWRLWIRLAHGLPDKDISSFPPPVEDTGFYIIVDGNKTIGPVLRPVGLEEWNEFFWFYIDLPDYEGGSIDFIRRTGGGWLWFDLIILSPRLDYDPRAYE